MGRKDLAKTLSPTKSGELIGTLTPSLKLGQPNRAERRAIQFPNKAERRLRRREVRRHREEAAAIFAQRKPLIDADQP